ncbi:hypothetical protein Vadar_026780 [Vaccinium darrowii]|uniref:Uncharacterized protein n=1 Tax=Vaccinium darrowii TaxID=229202 RepID=A0ACB7Y1T0_9ERIC|nr:hypothetical protein Vadar_026780 [Vaccinium darrowii]
MEEKANKKLKRAILIVNVTLLAIGVCGGPMVMRLYFIHGGDRVWLSSWLQTGGWPLNFIPLLATYLLRRRKEGPAAKLVFMGRRLFIGAAVVGVLSGFDNYFYAYGVARLPVSTSSLLAATHLTFIALFAFVLVKQKFTPYSINAVVLLTVGAGVLALHTSADRPKGESSKKYYMGFFMTIAAAVLYGFILPFMELTYKKARQAVTYTLVLEFQLVMSSIATLVCTIGMIVNNDFKTLVTTLLWGKETLELEEVTAALLAYNQRRQQTEGISGEGLVAKGREERGRKSERGRTGARGKSKSRGRTPEPKELKCYKCHKTGHFKKDCPYRKKNGGKGTWKEAGPLKSANVVEESSDDCDGDMLSV